VPRKTPLRRRLDACVEASDAREALLTAALAEASEVLDGSVTSGPVLSSGRALFDVALLHVIRATGLEGHPDQRHEQAAQMAMYVLIAVATPDWLPPHMQAAVQRAIDGGAATDVPTAVERAMWCHAAAVRAAFHREARPQLHLADVLVRAYQRVVEVAGLTVPGYPTRLLNLADAYEARLGLRRPDDPDAGTDLRAAVELVDDCLATRPTDPDVLLRAHLMRGQLRLRRWQLHADPADLDTAAESLQHVLDLSGPDSPRRADYLDQLRVVQGLRNQPAPPPDRGEIFVFIPADSEQAGAARIYQPDHTAHIRHRLKSMLARSATGVVIAVVAAVLIRWQTAGLDGQFRTLTTVVWLVDIVLLLVSALGAVITVILYLVYRHRRADLDAAGAEALAEFRARLHRR
jgi:hypothetical protein